MPFQFTTQITGYLLPEDGPAAKQEFLNHLNDQDSDGMGETYIMAYGFTLQPMVDELIASHQKGIPLHIYLDHSQAGGTMEKPQVQRLIDAGVEVTIGTSPEGSKYICHTKGIVSLDNPIWCWEGSVNFSEGGWHQVNTAMVFSSDVWAQQFIDQFKQIRQFAWDHERSYQLMSNPPQGVTDNPSGSLPPPKKTKNVCPTCGQKIKKPKNPKKAKKKKA